MERILQTAVISVVVSAMIGVIAMTAMAIIAAYRLVWGVTCAAL